MGFERPFYLARAAGTLLVAFSLDELRELLACARDAGHAIELLHVYHDASSLPTVRELERIASVLSRA